jgi:hypothetical protein
MKKVSFIMIIVFTIISIQTVYSEQLSDEIDQQQTDYNASTCLLGSVLLAQSFKPELETLTRVSLLMNKMGDLFGNSILSIRESLMSDDLTSVSKDSVEINEDMNWIDFDFPDIKIIPGDTYYIILNPDPDSDGGEGFNYLTWAFGWGDLYPRGKAYWQYNGSWNEGTSSHRSADYTFETYGIDSNNGDMVEITLSEGILIEILALECPLMS